VCFQFRDTPVNLVVGYIAHGSLEFVSEESCFLERGGSIVRNVLRRNVGLKESSLTSWINTFRASGSSGIDLVSVAEACDALRDLVVESISWGWSRFGCDDRAGMAISIASDSGLIYGTASRVSQWLLF
jgi:hypothetical protein